MVWWVGFWTKEAKEAISSKTGRGGVVSFFPQAVPLPPGSRGTSDDGQAVESKGREDRT